MASNCNKEPSTKSSQDISNYASETYLVTIEYTSTNKKKRIKL